MNHDPIYLGDILVNTSTGTKYKVIFDCDLAESIRNLENKTIEKLNQSILEFFVIKERREEGEV